MTSQTRIPTLNHDTADQQVAHLERKGEGGEEDGEGEGKGGEEAVSQEAKVV